jgi:GTP:adenosylcobinamide-phosphate guanylyltransferase
MDVILTAGGIPEPDDPLFAITNGLPKALMQIGGQTLIQWSLDALSKAESIDNVVLVGLPAGTEIRYSGTILRMENQGNLVSNITVAAQKLLENGASSPYALVMASDVPTVQPEILDWLTTQVEQADSDLVYTVVTREVMETRFPNSHRSYIKLKDVAVCGGDINAIRLDKISYDNPMWRRLVDTRKNALKQAALLGFDTLFKILTRSLTLEQTESRVCQKLGVNGKLLLSPYAEIAMDVDKPSQYELLNQELLQFARLREIGNQ